MNNDIDNSALDFLANQLEGDLLYDEMIRVLYATDASVYRALPQAVAFPRSDNDIVKLVHFANDNQTYLVPRAAGTSLAGQTVGEGIIVDCSRYLNQITEINTEERWALVEPGVIRNELNHHLTGTGLFLVRSLPQRQERRLEEWLVIIRRVPIPSYMAPPAIRLSR